MPTYMTLTRYTAEARAAVREQGYDSRERTIRQAIGSIGGTVESLHWTLSGEWDFLTIMTLPSAADSFAMGTQALSSGAVDHAFSVELLTSDEADAAIGKAMDWSPPQQS